ncbi:TMEM14 family protein [Leptolyngbya sp. AN02str]|uniref:TMEM14 family protein n=1 Tax=Leptolyngbya sp. AN02str TaxID=3423363 RepID=UPI003D30FE7C
MNAGIVAAIAYGILNLVGGFIGYQQAQSQKSLIADSFSGIFLILCGAVWAQGQLWAKAVAIVAAAILIQVFIWRYVKTRKFMPAGLMIAVGVAAIAVMVAS